MRNVGSSILPISIFYYESKNFQLQLLFRSRWISEANFHIGNWQYYSNWQIIMKAKLPFPHDCVRLLDEEVRKKFSSDEFKLLLSELERKIEELLEIKINDEISLVDYALEFLSSDYARVLGHVSGGAYLPVLGRENFKRGFKERYKGEFSRMLERFRRERWDGVEIYASVLISGARECGEEEVEIKDPEKPL